MKPESCRECGHSVEWGSGMFVNRLSCGDGEYLCAECQLLECDRCGEPNMPDDFYYVGLSMQTMACEGCVTKEERDALAERGWV
jgi:hypothetical protein